jgi:hypothetical protein
MQLSPYYHKAAIYCKTSAMLAGQQQTKRHYRCDAIDLM